MTIDEFQNVDLRVGKVLAAERVPNSEKLIKLQVGLGGETRQVVAGIGRAYEPGSLLGKEIVIVYNLEPRELVGEKSEGMLLAAHGESSEPVILTADKEVPPGSKIS
jgi:methionyl-tRNA synthetase